MNFLSAIFLATSALPVHAHVSSWHDHGDRGHQHQSNVHVHDALDHVSQDLDGAQVQTHALSAIDIGHDLVGPQPLSVQFAAALGRLVGNPAVAKSALAEPPESASSVHLQPVPYDSEPRAPPA